MRKQLRVRNAESLLLLKKVSPSGKKKTKQKNVLQSITKGQSRDSCVFVWRVVSMGISVYVTERRRRAGQTKEEAPHSLVHSLSPLLVERSNNLRQQVFQVHLAGL